MNRRFSFFLAAVLYGAASLSIVDASPEPGDFADRTLDAGDVLAMALASSFNIRIERIASDIAEQGVRGAQGLYDPSLLVAHHYDFGEEQDTFNSTTVGITGLLPWGGDYGLHVNSSRWVPEGTASAVGVPSAESRASVSFRQPLLSGFARGPQWASIRVARNRSSQSDEDFREAVMSAVTAALLAYNDLYFWQRNLQVARRNQQLAEQLLRDNQDRVSRGAIAPADILQAESTVAVRRGLVIDAERNLHDANNYLLSLLVDDLAPHLGIQVSVVAPEIPGFEPRDALRDLETAFNLRPDYRRALLNIDLREIELERASNQALPRLDLVGDFGYRGVGGSRGDSISNLRDNGQSVYGAGVEFSVPIPNRTARSERIAAGMRLRQDETLLDRHRQQILLILDRAARRVETEWRRLEIAREGRDLAQRALVAEERRLSVGSSSSFFVLSLQGDLANAERNEAFVEREYLNARILYLRELGTILLEHNIQLP